MPKRLTQFSLLILCLGRLLFAESLAADSAIVTDRNRPQYHWGRGLTLPSLDLTVGGYASISYKHFETEPDRVTIDDLSLFLTWTPHARLRFFSELEFEETVIAGEPRERHHFFSVERLYVDFLANQHITLRFGKSLTPVGRWNLIHAAPLVWTTSRPLVTEPIIFPLHTTGLMARANFFFNQQDLDFYLYADDSNDLDPKKEPISLENGFGGRVTYQPSGGLQIGASYLNFKERARVISGPRNHLFGLDLFWTKNQFEIQSEMVYRLADGGRGDQKGLYLQGVAPLGYRLFAIGRYEYFDGSAPAADGLISTSTNLGIAALAWRPYAPLVIKAEYRFGSKNRIIAPSGFFTSIAVLF